MRHVLFFAVLGLLPGCGVFGSDVPDQSQFAPLADLAAQDQAFVRLYGDEIAPIQMIAIHLSFVIKTTGSSDLQLWELQPGENGPFGHIRLTDSVDNGQQAAFFNRAFVIAEIFGDRAQSVADFIQNQSPVYPCRNAYGIFGPNSNTYAVWILQQTGWNVPLSGRAIGKDAIVNCP